VNNVDCCNFRPRLANFTYSNLNSVMWCSSVTAEPDPVKASLRHCLSPCRQIYKSIHPNFQSVITFIASCQIKNVLHEAALVVISNGLATVNVDFGHQRMLPYIAYAVRGKMIQESCIIAKMTVQCANKSTQTATPPPKITWLSVDSVQPDVMDVGVEETFSPKKFLHVLLGVSGWSLRYEKRRYWANCSRN